MVNDSFQQRLRRALEKATAELLAERNTQGFWEGELSSSALSTATAVTAIALALKHGTNPQSQFRNPQSSIQPGLKWLAEKQNADGGWGDTTKSLSNISTTTLCWAAFGAAGADERFSETVRRAEEWLLETIRPYLPSDWSADSHVRVFSGTGSRGHGCPRSALARAIIARYGQDRTFSVPILTMCALAGRLGDGRAAWRHVIPLPFELAAFPHRFFAALRLPVVSYALPALIAIGQARHVHAPSWNPFARLVRLATRKRTLRKLTEIQPPNGGFLEATPLTSFVTMSLAGSGQANHVVTRRGLEFLLKSQRADGSWPIDTNLATWCTTLAVNALPESALADGAPTLDWLLRQQYRTVHPYTNAAPGGWAWTDLPGGVPDADDTAGALLALERLQTAVPEAERGKVREAAVAGLRWLKSLQSDKDLGVPTFCRGWGRLPFDRSAPDITGHAVRAWMKWLPHLPELGKELFGASVLGLVYLDIEQREAGAWVPLWFGNQHARDEENRVYGTARVILGTTELCAHPRLEDACIQSGYAAYDKGVRWLVEAQGADGGWNGDGHGPSSVEETAVATEALAQYVRYFDDWRAAQAVRAGATWLIERVETGRWRETAPVGFYFAKLWYFERLYPMIFTVGALRKTAEWLEAASGET